MIIYALIVRTKDGMALSATTDFNDEVNKTIKESKIYVKLLAKKASHLPDRCTLYLSLHSVHFITALGVTYLALCESSYPTVLAFSFLSELMRDFITKYETVRINMARRPYSFIEFDNFIHKTRQRYNKPQSLTTRVNLAELSEEMRLRAPHLLNISDIEPVKNGYRNINIPQVSVGPPPRLEPLTWYGLGSIVQASLLSTLGIYRSLKALSESSLEQISPASGAFAVGITHYYTHGRYGNEESNTIAEYDGPSPSHGLIFLLESCLRIFQVMLLLQLSRYRVLLSWLDLALLCLCGWLVWDLRDEWQCSLFIASAIVSHVAVILRSSGSEPVMSGGMELVTADSAEPINHYFHQSPDHCSDSLAAINRMRQNIQLCDVTLKVGTESIHAHRVVLASSSPYFYAMFNDDMAERAAREVVLHDLDRTALQLLVDYSYTGEIHITEENVQVLLPASSLLQISSVREACCKFLMRQLHPSNCLGIRSFADAHACKELHKRSHRFALQNFQEVMSTEEFLLLPFSEVEELISSNQLNIASEEKVFLAVLSWVKHDVAERVQYIAKLLRHVRLPLMSRDFLMTSVEAEALVRESGECRELLLEAMKYHLLPEQRSQLASTRTAERRPEGIKPYIFAVGGGSLFAIHSECECYNPRDDRWLPIAPMLFRRSRSGVTGLGKLLYVVGGYDGASDLATAECYSPQTNKWSTITPMGTKRSCLGICGFDGLIYVCGGYDGASCLSSMERFDPLTGVWSSCPAMATRRRYCRIAVVENCIYALGGFDSTNYQSSVERLDPRVGRWQAVPSMSSRRSSCGVAATDGLLYCVGGNDGTMCMSSGERFNVRRNTWEPIAPMHSRRSTHEVVACEGTLLALGGNDGSSSLNSVERYDPRLNKWTIVTSMLTRRSSVGAAMLECFNVERGLPVVTPVTTVKNI